MIPLKARKPGVSTNVYIFITGTNTLYKMIQIWFVSKRVLHVYTQLGLDELMSGTAYQKLVLSGSLSITSASLYLSIFPPTGSFITFFLVCLKFRVDPMFSFSFAFHFQWWAFALKIFSSTWKKYLESFENYNPDCPKISNLPFYFISSLHFPQHSFNLYSLKPSYLVLLLVEK